MKRSLLIASIVGLSAGISHSQDCLYEVVFPAGFYIIDNSSIDITVDYTAVVALSAAQDLSNACGFTPRVDTSGEAYAGMYTFLSANAFSPNGDIRYSNYAEGEAVAGYWNARNAAGVWTELRWGRAGRFPVNDEWCCAPGDSLAFAAAACELEITSNSSLIGEITLDGETQLGGDKRGYVAAINRSTGTPYASLLRTNHGNLATGWTFNSTTNQWEYNSSTPVQANQTITVDVFLVRAEDDRLDVNSDGRPNSLDVAALGAVVGTSSATDPALLENYDYDYDGVITQDDVDTFGMILDSGVDAGIINDTDGNGTVDCNDLVSNIPAVGTVITDTDYYVQIDRDLDGKISLEDRREYLLDLQPADANLNGVVESTDYNAWINAYNNNDPAADANRNGVVESTDYNAWIAAYNTGGCP